MDAKASAKSKRAHTHQTKRAHSHPNPKNPNPSAGNLKKPQKQKSLVKNHHNHNLPSNWDRYDEDEGLGNEDPAESAADSSPAEGVPAPKSKGADFSELISRAREEARTRLDADADCFFPSDDALSGFYQGVGSMLFVKGNNLLSWSGHDSFILDESEASSYEASFLSLDLHALAAQLENVDISQRLFIESDLLSGELCEQSEETCSLHSDHGETSHATGMDESSWAYGHRETSPMVGKHYMPKTLGNDSEAVLAASTCSENLQDFHSHNQTMRGANEGSFPASAWQSGNSDPATDSELFHQNGAAEVIEHLSQLNAAAELKEKMNWTSAAIPADAELDMLLNTINDTEEKAKTLDFEAVKAEEELDILLNSFGENLHRESIGGGEPSSNFPESSITFFGESSAFLSAKSVRQATDSSKNASRTNTLDDAIDDLLAAAPIVSNQDRDARRTSESLTSEALPSSRSCPKALDDFDSWLDTL